MERAGAIPPFVAEGIIGCRMPSDARPKRIVVVRLQAFGDAVIVLPLLAGLRRAYPGAHITIVTSALYREFFESIGGIDAVRALPMQRSKILRGAAAAWLGASLGAVDLLLDLQRSTFSLFLGSLIRKRWWTAFDRFAPRSALDRYLDAARWVRIDIVPLCAVDLHPEVERRGAGLLRGGDPRGGLSGDTPLVCLNPAGCWPTKHWPVEYYIELGRRAIAEWGARIVLLGTGNVAREGGMIARELRGDVIDLIGRTSAAEALAVVKRLHLMVSDDSGLMHLAWVAGVPVVGLFGSSRRVWSGPQGEQTRSFGSEDLPCGCCMSATCTRGDLHCLRRLDVDDVFEACREIFHHGVKQK